MLVTESRMRAGTRGDETGRRGTCGKGIVSQLSKHRLIDISREREELGLAVEHQTCRPGQAQFGSNLILAASGTRIRFEVVESFALLAHGATVHGHGSGDGCVTHIDMVVCGGFESVALEDHYAGDADEGRR